MVTVQGGYGALFAVRVQVFLRDGAIAVKGSKWLGIDHGRLI
jgi:flagellar basal body L-ring protein FlgH